jgi:hypothetical protein
MLTIDVLKAHAERRKGRAASFGIGPVSFGLEDFAWPNSRTYQSSAV